MHILQTSSIFVSTLGCYAKRRTRTGRLQSRGLRVSGVGNPTMLALGSRLLPTDSLSLLVLVQDYSQHDSLSLLVLVQDFSTPNTTVSPTR
jgi:hypothetical protein